MTILVVDDESRIAAFVRKGLNARGYHAESVGTGGAALARIARGGVALVILDLGLPDLDGIEVLRRVHREGTRLPVIVLTARNDAEDRIRELGLPIAGFVTKPFAFAHLAECVRAGIVNGRET